jgi:hypothetical protein
VGIYGGYAGVGAPNPDDRNIDAHETILSGDLTGDDGYFFDNNNENSYHVVTGSRTDVTAILDGFTVTGGNANGSEPNDRGAGMFNVAGHPTLGNCIFVDNIADGSDTGLDARGAGMYNAGGNPVLTDCVFRGNFAIGGFATSGLGAGMYNRDGSRPMLTRCVFSDNKADGGWETGLGAGGGMFNYNDSRPTLVSCIFRRNQAGSFGGGLVSSESSPTLINCLFSANATFAWADRDYGGGVAHGGSGTPVLINCTFVDNHAEFGGGLYNGCATPTTVTNCIFWHNADRSGSSESAQIWVASLDMNYTCVEGLTGGLGGTGNIGDDPLFSDADGGDAIPGTDDDDLRLTNASPCINAGDPALKPDPWETDSDGHARVLCEQVDMGAYEFGIGDYDCSDGVNLTDFTSWPACMTGPFLGPYGIDDCKAFDFEFDEDVDLQDFAGFQMLSVGQ